MPTSSTFLFTDIENSTWYWNRPAIRFQIVKNWHDSLLRALSADHGGREASYTGDGFFFLFDNPVNAVLFAIDAHDRIGRPPAEIDRALTGLPPIRVRIGLHYGELPDHDGFDGPATNAAARICAAGHGRQTVASRDVLDACGDSTSSVCTFSSLGEYCLKGFDTSFELFQIDPVGATGLFPALRAAAVNAVRLPTYSTRFVGREHEIESISRLAIGDRSFVVELVGAGGIGKTRLAVEIARAVADRFPDGVWFVDPADSSDRSAFHGNLAMLFGLSLQPGASVDAAVIEHAAGRRILLVLDGFEACADAESILGELATSKVSCIVTTRVRTSLLGVSHFDIEPLSRDRDGKLESLSDAEALFVDRAKMQDSGFELTPSVAAGVRRLCDNVDGLPLALELAAAWIPYESVDQIAGEVAHKLDLLAADLRDLAPRQRAMRACLSLSVDHLSAEMRRRLVLLSVFENRFSREAAVAIWQSGTLSAGWSDGSEALRLLRSCSLLDRDQSSSDGLFRMLNVTRIYCREQLHGLSEAETAYDRHTGYFAQQCRDHRNAFRSPGEADALVSFEFQRSDIGAALERALRRGQDRSAMELAFGLAAYYQRIGYAETGQAVVSRVPAGQWAPDRDGDDTSFWFDVLCVSLLIDLDRLSRARSAASRILSRLRGGASSPEALRRRGAILNLIGLIERAEGRPDHARKRLRAALRCLPADDADIAAQISNNLGLIELDDPSGDAVRAEKLLSDALSRFVELGDKRGQAEARINLGLAAERRGALDIADEMYSASLALELELGHRLGVARALTNLAEVASVKGEAQRAYREQIVAEWLFAEIASPYARSRNWLTEKVKTEAKARREDVELALASFAHFDLRRLIEWATLAPPV